MRDQFFRLYIDIKVAERYYCRYTDRSVLWNNVITGFCLLTSAATICSWPIWSEAPIIWAIFLAGAQVLAVLRPLFKSAARLSAAKYLLPELSELIDNVTSTWHEIQYVRTFSEQEIYDATRKYRAEFTAICERFASSELFPEKEALHKAAQEDAKIYFAVQYNIPKEKMSYEE